MEEKEKKIDQEWKEKIEQEKQTQHSEQKEEPLDVEPDFSFFITTLSIQAAISLGEVPNPVTNQTEQNLNQAKLIIDTLSMLKEKTQGNLNAEEDSLLDSMLYELRLKYISKTKEQNK